MKSTSESLRIAATAALAALGSTSPAVRAHAATNLDAALNSNPWTLVSPETLPGERIRVVACVGTVVYEDCFYGYGSSARSPFHDQKLWRDTHQEQPLAYVPAYWTAMAPTPIAYALAKALPVVIQEAPKAQLDA